MEQGRGVGGDCKSILLHGESRVRKVGQYSPSAFRCRKETLLSLVSGLEPRELCSTSRLRSVTMIPRN